MSQYDELLKWCRSRRLTMLDDLKPLEAGKMTMGANDGYGWRDITQEWDAETKRVSAAELELETIKTETARFQTRARRSRAVSKCASWI